MPFTAELQACARLAEIRKGTRIRNARTASPTDDRLFGIKHEDRFSHVYVIGKTGTGKSTLLETIALQDLERGNGFALIDPHGDLVARVAARVPVSQRNRVIYLNTTDPVQPYGYNPLPRRSIAARGSRQEIRCLT
jgi:DNA helicase HerA-like ATPase